MKVIKIKIQAEEDFLKDRKKRYQPLQGNIDNVWPERKIERQRV